MWRWTVILAIIHLACNLWAQDMDQLYQAHRQKYPDGPALNRMDSLYFLRIPEKHLPPELRASPLPPVLDNAVYPYLRPVFQQDGASCGQAALIGYNFTFEIDRYRDLPADTSANQYPTHFAWNFQNEGEGWGVSYFHSLEILRQCGSMTVDEYGGMGGDQSRWISGYDVYYKAMLNRIKGYYNIRTDSEEGLLTLKHWLFDHLEGAQVGGLASFYSNTTWNAKRLNDTTPEGGKYVMIWWYPSATHAMTIIGYNDSIRWDYNLDGLYTNNVDLNQDGRIDPRDWEIGGVRFINSWGLETTDSGYCYMMYKALADRYGEGGIWNNAVQILDVNEDYAPLVTFKVTLKHDCRRKIKVLAGISMDTAMALPEYTMDFPIFNFQGGNHFMQGPNSAEEYKSIEFGLDVTPLLSYAEPGRPVKFYLVVDEHDPEGSNTGEIVSFSMMDYTGGIQEHASGNMPLPLANNKETIAAVTVPVSFNKVQITTASLPPFERGTPYQAQLAAEGGKGPYRWEPAYIYREDRYKGDFPEITGVKIIPNTEQDTVIPVPLPFSFPFYGNDYDTVYAHIDGYLQLDSTLLPWPYLEEYDLLLRNNRIIAPVTNRDFTIGPYSDDAVWYEPGENSITFRWNLSCRPSTGNMEINTAVKLYRDGTIELYYGRCILDDIPLAGGISDGTGRDFQEAIATGVHEIPEGIILKYSPAPFPLGIKLEEDGLLHGTTDEDRFIYDLKVRVRDQNDVGAARTFSFSSGLELSFTVESTGDNQISYGDEVLLNVVVRNISPDTLKNINLHFSTTDTLIEMTGSDHFIGLLGSGEEYTADGVASFHVSIHIPDQHDFILRAEVDSETRDWTKELAFSAIAPDVTIHKYSIEDGNDGKLYPGETGNINVIISNHGHAAIGSLLGVVSSLDDVLEITGPPEYYYGNIPAGSSVSRLFRLHVSDSACFGSPLRLVFRTSNLEGLTTCDTLEIRVGKTPVLVIDMDPNHHSGPVIRQILDETGVMSAYEEFIPADISDYQSLFICLGYHYSNHVLTSYEGSVLADYLNQGGRIYMEGKKTWKDDPVTPVHSMFRIGYTGTATIYDTLTGSDSTFLEGLEFVNGAQHPFSFYNIVAVDPAFTILEDNDKKVSAAVAFDGGDYRTIGSLFEIGTLSDISPSAREELVRKILDFFGVVTTSLGEAELHPDPFTMYLKVCPNPAVNQLEVGCSSTTVHDTQSLVMLILEPSGRVIRKLENISGLPFRVDISALKPGFYILQVISDNGQSGSVKFMKFSY